jgi:hypothetical protein
MTGLHACTGPPHGRAFCNGKFGRQYTTQHQTCWTTCNLHLTSIMYHKIDENIIQPLFIRFSYPMVTNEKQTKMQNESYTMKSRYGKTELTTQIWYLPPRT